MEGLLAHLLAHELAARLHTDDDTPALAVRECAERLQRFTQLRRRALELERRGLALAMSWVRLEDIDKIILPLGERR